MFKKSLLAASLTTALLSTQTQTIQFFMKHVPIGLSRMYVHEVEIAKSDGFQSAGQMFNTLDKMYNLASPKTFWVYRWRWL